MEAIDILRKHLIGNFYSTFILGDSWSLFFDRYWLVAQEIKSDDEMIIGDCLKKHYPLSVSAIDKDQIAQGVVVSTLRRRLIVDVSLDSAGALTLKFENSAQLFFPTNVEIVDWQWALSEKEGDPYLGFIVGCLVAGEVEVGKSWIS